MDTLGKVGKGTGTLREGAVGCGKVKVSLEMGSHRVNLLMMLLLGEWKLRTLGHCRRQRTARRRQCVDVCLSFDDFGTIPVKNSFMSYTVLIFDSCQ